MSFRKFWISKLIILAMIFIVACGNPDNNSLPTQAPIASINDDENENTTADNEETSAEEAGETATQDEGAPENGDQPSADEQNSADLIPLPGLNQSQVASSAPAAGLGGGGGGGLVSESAAVGVAQDLAIDYVGIDIFESTAFVLNSTLPTEPTRAQVQRQSSFTITLDEARAIASQFGFEGPIYQQPLPEGVDVIEEVAYTTVFFAFDDNGRTLNMDSFGIYYNDSNFQFESLPNLTLAEAGPIAEAFLQARGLLDFDYVIEKGWGNEIWFKRLIRGAVVNQPERTVSVTNEGNILFASVQRFDNLERLGNYPLRSAADAWSELQGGVTANQIPFAYAPNFEDQPIAPEPAFEETYQYWQRSYAPGTTATIFTWPTVFVAADDSAPPRVEAYPFLLQGDPADLEAIAAQAYTQMRIEGVVGANGRLLNITEWETVTDYPENLYLQGTVIFDEGQALFVTDDGETYVVPDAPADLPEGERLNIFAWEARPTEGPFPALAWENIDIFINYDEAIIDEPVVLDDIELYQPTVYETMTINKVDLVYFFAYIYPEFDENNPSYGPPTTLMKPVWQFSGEADNGDLINFYVDAVAAEYIE